MSMTPRDFIKLKLKERNLTFDFLSEKININRTKLFRLLQPEAVLPLVYRDRIINILGFNIQEKEDFLSTLQSNVFVNQLETENPWLNFLFTDQIEENSIKNSVTSYNKGIPTDISLEDFTNNITNTIRQSQNIETLRLRIYVCGCFYVNLLTPLFNIVANIKDSKIRHFINLPINDLNCAIYRLNHIMQATKYIKYRAYQSDFEGTLWDTFLIECGNTYYYGDIRLGKLHFYSSSSTNLFTFWKNKYDSFWPQYKEIIIENKEMLGINFYDQSSLHKSLRSILECSQIFWNLEGNYQHMIFKSNMCYDAVPRNFYYSLLDSVLNDEITNISDDNKVLIGELLNIVDLRNRHKVYSKDNNSIDFYTIYGIKSFIKTGKLSDHLPGLKEFDYNARIHILKSLINTNQQEQNFHMYISEREFFDNKYAICCFNGYGFAVEHLIHNEDNQFTSTSYCVIELKDLSTSLWEHMNNSNLLEGTGLVEVTEEILSSLIVDEELNS